MTNWWNYFKDPIFFISPDVKRGLGIEDRFSNYHIICSYFDSIIPILRKQGAKIFCLEEEEQQKFTKIKNTGHLMENPLVEDYIKKYSKKTPAIAYFKPSLKIDQLIAQKKFLKIGNSGQVNEMFENKVSSVNLINKECPHFLIPFQVGTMGEMNFKNLVKRFNLPFVLQFGHGWAGKTTFFIENDAGFNRLKQKFVHTKVKVSKHIDGFTILNNCCIFQGKVLHSPPAIQIDSIPQLSHQRSVTCGRQWPVKFISKKTINSINQMTQKIGKLLHQFDYQGYFGLDFIIEGKSGQVFLSEVNARLTASSAFYTKLEIGLKKIPLLIFHFAQFLKINLPVEKDITSISNNTSPVVGSQVIIRNQATLKKIAIANEFCLLEKTNNHLKKVKSIYLPSNLKDNQFIYITQKHINPEGELARFETKMEVLEKPHTLNKQFFNFLIGNVTLHQD